MFRYQKELVIHKFSTLHLKKLKLFQLKPIHFLVYRKFSINIKNNRNIILRIFKNIIKQTSYLYAFSTYF